MTILLAIDTSQPLCSVALWNANQGTLLERIAPKPQQHTKSLVGMVEEILHAGDVTHAELQSIAVTIGPGSFTGIRIGIASAKAMALALRIPLHPITTMQIWAAVVIAEAAPQEPILICYQAYPTQYYGQLFDSTGLPLSSIMDSEGLKQYIQQHMMPTVLGGNAVQAFLSDSATLNQRPPQKIISHFPGSMALWAAQVAKSGLVPSVERTQVQPLYLQNHYAMNIKGE